MTAVLLHVGPHKTGSTYLQSCFSHYRAALQARGIAVPAAWEHAPGNASHTGLTSALRDPDRMAAAQGVVDEIWRSGCGTLLVSAEDLSALGVEPLQRLRQLLGDSDVTVIFYVRRWSDLLPSGWQEMVKQGFTISFPEFLLRTCAIPWRRKYLNWV